MGATFGKAFGEGGEGSAAALACGIGFFGYIGFMGARACMRARDPDCIDVRLPISTAAEGTKKET